MNWGQRITGVVVVLLLSSRAVATDVTKVSWHTNVQNAWQATQQQGRPLLVFVTRDNCFYCTQMKDRTYNNVSVTGTIKQSFVPLVLDGGEQSQLLKELNVTSFPSTIIISPQAVIVDRIDGYVPPEVLTGRLLALRPQMPVAKLVKDP